MLDLLLNCILMSLRDVNNNSLAGFRTRTSGIKARTFNAATGDDPILSHLKTLNKMSIRVFHNI